MPLHDTDSLIVETVTAAETLPDPTTVSGRTHDLTNTSAVTAVWGSTGATPFQVDGVAVATLSVPRGGTARVQSDGVRWVFIRPVGSRPGFAATAVTNGSGDAVFTFPAGLFPAAPVAAAAIQAADSQNPIDYRITGLTATGCTVRCRQSPIVVVLSLSVVGASAPIAGVTVHLVATPAGATP